MNKATLSCHQTLTAVPDSEPGHAVAVFLAPQVRQQTPDEDLSPWQVLLVSSSRHPDQWIVPGGGMEPEEEPCGAAVREVYEEVSPSPITKLRKHAPTDCKCSSTFCGWSYFKAASKTTKYL